MHMKEVSMGRSKKPDLVSGVIVIDKHPGVTSHRIVQILRKLYDTPRVGHTGTLDPMATGVLPILLGRAAKASDFVTAGEKEYDAVLHLGITTDTQDVTGAVLSECDGIPEEAEVRKAIQSFVGDIAQIPPMYSAIKVDGQKLVDAARRGEVVERAPRPVHIDSICITPLTERDYRLQVVCSKGTYIRTLCADIGEKLGCGGAMGALRRVRSGSFTLKDAVTIEQLEAASMEERISMVRPCDTLFSHCPALTVNDFQAKLVRGGTELYQNKLGTRFPVETLVRLYQKGVFFALGEVKDFPNGSAIKPIRLFVL